MHRLLTVVGARPQLIKAAAFSRAVATRSDLDEVLIHTGQHYDHAMSEGFFTELGLPAPAVNLGIHGGGHGQATGRMLMALEEQLLTVEPDLVVLYGDTNSTLAGALAASKLHVPVAHVEAGLRSFNRRMPEELNRVLTDHVSTLLFCPTAQAVENLAQEGITSGVEHVGDVMHDCARLFGPLARQQSEILNELDLTDDGFYLATCHRAGNVDDPARLTGILDALERLGQELPVVLPLHPRTRAALEALGRTPRAGVRVTDPLPFLDVTRLLQGCRVLLTDSGGMQKEAYFHGRPCVTLRDDTEWVETIAAGWNRLAGADPDEIVDAVRTATTATSARRSIPDYGDGTTAATIADAIARFLSTHGRGG